MLFSLISSPRSGTTAFRSLFNQNAEVFLYGEVLFPDYFSWGFFSWLAAARQAGRRVDLPHQWADEFIPFLDNITGVMFESGKRSVGIDLKWGQIQAVFGLDKKLTADNLGVVHLVRRNVAATVLSQIRMEVAHATGKPVHLEASGSMNAPEIIPISVTGAYLQARIDELVLEERKIQEIYGSQKYLKIHYEDIFVNGAAKNVEEALSAFLDAQVTLQRESAFKKMGSTNLLDGVDTDDAGADILASYMLVS